MRAPRRSARAGAALGGILVTCLLGGVLALSPIAARADDGPPSGGGNLSVNVTDDSSPSPTPGQADVVSDTGSEGVPASVGSAGSGGSSGSAGVGAGGGGGGSPANASGEVSVGGVLYVGGLNAATTTSSDPGEGTVTLWFTVRNASKMPIDATARFWMNSMLLPHQLDAVSEVRVAALRPGETRVATAQLHHAGQWTLISAHATLTPPATVDGVALKPITRDATVVAFPWLLVLLFLLGAVGFVAARIRSRVQASRPAAAPIATDAA